MNALPQAHPLPDQLFRAIELEYRGHDPAVLKSYTQFLEVGGPEDPEGGGYCNIGQKPWWSVNV